MAGKRAPPSPFLPHLRPRAWGLTGLAVTKTKFQKVKKNEGKIPFNQCLPQLLSTAHLSPLPPAPFQPLPAGGSGVMGRVPAVSQCQPLRLARGEGEGKEEGKAEWEKTGVAASSAHFSDLT